MKIIKLTNKEIYVLNEGALRKLVSVKNRTWSHKYDLGQFM
jgi:hypothetical protein